MAENNERLVIEETAMIASDDQNQVVQYDEQERLSDRQAVLCPETGNIQITAYIIGAQQSINLANPGGPTVRFSASATGSRKPKTGIMERSNIAAETVPTTEVATWTASTSGFSAIPYDCAGSAIYQIAIRNNDVPAEARLKLNGDRTWLRWEHAIGERLQPASVAEQAVPGSGLRITMTPTNETLPWTDVARTRPVRVWYHPGGTAVDDPPLVTGDETSEAIHDGVLETDGAAVWIDVPHYFGEAAPGVLTANLYHVHLYGFSIIDRATTDYTTISVLGVQTYIVLAEFDFAAGTLSYAEQLDVLSLPELSVITTPAANLTDALRSGAKIGDGTATALWNDAPGTGVAGGFLSFTYADPISVSGEYLHTGAFTGPTGGLPPTVSSIFRAGGLVAAMADTVGAGTYAIVAYVDASNLLYLDTYLPALTAAHERQYLVVATYDWNGAAVTAYYPRDLNARRGVAWGSLVGSGQETNGEHLTVHDLMLTQSGTDTIVNFFGLDGQSPRQTARFGYLRYNTATWPDPIVDLTLNPHIATAGNLGANELVRVVLGNTASDYTLTAYGAAAAADKYLEILDDTAAVFEHRRIGGLPVTGTGRTLVEDVHLLSGKDVWYVAPIEGGAMATGVGGWQYNTDPNAAAKPDACSWYYRTEWAVEERWLSATTYANNVGDFKTINVGTTGTERFTFECPRDMAFLIDLDLIGISGGVAAADPINLDCDYGALSEQYNNHTGASTLTYAIPAVGDLFTVDVSPIFGSLLAGDFCGLLVTHNTTANAHDYIGIRIRYLPQPYDATWPQALDLGIGPLAAAAGAGPTGIADTIRDVRVFGEANNIGGMTSDMTLQLYDLDMSASTLTAVAGAVKTVVNGVAPTWHALTPGAPVTIQRAHRYFVRAIPTIPDLSNCIVSHMEYQVRRGQFS